MTFLRRLTIAAALAFAVAVSGTAPAAAQETIDELPDAITQSALYERTDDGWAVSEVEVAWERQGTVDDGIIATATLPDSDMVVTIGFAPGLRWTVQGQLDAYGIGAVLRVAHPDAAVSSAYPTETIVDVFDRFGWLEYAIVPRPLAPAQTTTDGWLFLAGAGFSGDILSVTPLSTALGLRIKFDDDVGTVAVLDLTVDDTMRAYVGELISGWVTNDADPRGAILYDVQAASVGIRAQRGWITDLQFAGNGDIRWQLAGEGADAEIIGQVAIPGLAYFTLSLRGDADSGDVVIRLTALTDHSRPAIVGWEGFAGKFTERDPGQSLTLAPRDDDYPYPAVQPIVFTVSATPRKVDYLLQANWFDIYLANADGTGTLLAISKGDTGRAVFDQAFAAWGLTPAGAE